MMGSTFLGTGKSHTKFYGSLPMRDQEFLVTGKTRREFMVVDEFLKIVGIQKCFVPLPLEWGQQSCGRGCHWVSRRCGRLLFCVLFVLFFSFFI